jgi:ABC-type transporter Mla subunit MlaD
MGKSLDEVASRITAHVEEAENRLSYGAQNMGKSLDEVASRITSHVEQAENRLSHGAENMGEKLGEHVARVEQQLVDRANVISETFTAVGQRIGQSTNEAARTIGANTKELNAVLAERAAEITRILDETARPLIDRFSESGNDLAGKVEEVTARTTERLRAENDALINALASRTAETLSSIGGARDTLASGVAGLLDRLSASTAHLNDLVGQASESLSVVDERLVASTQSFAASTERAANSFSTSATLVENNTNRLTELSSATLREVASIATKFDSHSRLLSSAADLLSSAQSNLEHTLERQSSLEDLAVGLVKKSEELERVMRSYESLVGNAVSEAENRTLESTGKIQQAMGEVIESATKRFADATEDMRRIAAGIKSELDETRSEIKKGVFELPMEAKESTTAIRRAVAEQVSALKELSAIVARSGRNTDTSEARQPRAEAPRRPAQPTPAPAPAPRPLAPRAPVAEAPSHPAADTVKTPQGGGWVRDLLTGASREEAAVAVVEQPAPKAAQPNRSPLQVVESLNSLSVDIARAIDHEASIELWNRYRRGERDVFTRRLYTLKGQQTFDDIRAKYQTDGEFRAAVDRYCDDFEKLLKDVSRNDRDNMMTQTYLTSDTGKVYTMLAHASGRLR